MKLALSSTNILDISIDCGFSSLAYFYKVFKQHYNMTPRQYRLNRQSLVINFDGVEAYDRSSGRPGDKI